MNGDLFCRYPAQVSLDDERAIVSHLRALLDLHDLLLNGYDAELQAFVSQLSAYGWGSKQIAEFIQRSGQYTRYETMIDHPMPEAGDRGEYNANCERWRK